MMDASAVAAITAMGFSEAAAHRGLRRAGLDLERAIEWILLNGGGDDSSSDDDEGGRGGSGGGGGSRLEAAALPPPPDSHDSTLQALQRLEAINVAWEADVDEGQSIDPPDIDTCRTASTLLAPPGLDNNPHSLLLEGTPLRVAGKPGEPRGRWFELLEARPAGTDLLVERAFVVAPAQFSAETCCHCLRVRSAEELAAAAGGRGGRGGGALCHNRCILCNADETSFCSERCKEQWGTRHEQECPLIEPLLGLLFDTPGAQHACQAAKRDYRKGARECFADTPSENDLAGYVLHMQGSRCTTHC